MFPLPWTQPIKRQSKQAYRYITGLKGKPIVNSADAGERIDNIDLAAANDAIIIALCSKRAYCGQ